MSKFHDEFFRQGSPVHDALMIKCLSKYGIDKILSAIGSIQIEVPPITVTKCTTKNQLMFTLAEKDEIFYEDGNCKRGNRCTAHWDCEYKNPQEHPGQFQPTYYKPITSEEITVHATFDVEYSMKKETEVIVRNGTFILGYADGIISEETVVRAKYNINEVGTVREINYYGPSRKTIIEAKPEITSIGEVIRQLKTYASLIGSKNARMVIATYSKLGEDALEYLSNENIIVVQFDRS